MYYIGLYQENMKKIFWSETTRPRASIFSMEPRYLVCSITYWTSTKLIEIIPVVPKMVPSQRRIFYISLDRGNIKNLLV